MANVLEKKPSSRITFPLAGGSTIYAASSTAVTSGAAFSTQCRQVRIATDLMIKFLIQDGPNSANSTNSTLWPILPANSYDYFTVSPGQFFNAFVTTGAVAANVSVTEVY